MLSPLNIIFIALAALVVMLTIFIVLVRYNSQKQIEYQREQIQRLRARADEFMPPRLKAIDDWKMEVHTAIKLAEKDRPKRRGEEREQYDRHLFNTILLCNRVELFFRLADKHLDGFATRMSEDYQLSDREVLFICLSLLALSDEQIALIMDYSFASIPTTRKRIAKKLEITNISDWNSRLLDLVNQE